MRAALLALIVLIAPQVALAQSCPAPLADARRIALVTADGFSTSAARLQLYERDAPGGPWHARAEAEPALIGKRGMAWSYFFRTFSRRGEPRKVEGDKRVPAGFYRIGKSFGTLPPNRANYVHLTEGITCVDDLNSSAYNTISSRAKVGWKVHGENMWRVPEYARGLLVDYPTDAKARAGSCIFIHLRLPNATGTSGCVALPEPQLINLQNFAQDGAVLAVLPKQALDRFKGCLPQR
jgi:L,D-peptidoglycan transpeptidase YkuD (ErfK/YbiS/YcfS/YnhG family)